MEEKSPYPKEANEEEEGINWQIREYGDLQQFNLAGKDEGSATCYGTIVIRNLTWPGAHLIAQNKSWTNIYVGYGNKLNQNPFEPVQPERVYDEGEDRDEFREVDQLN